MSKSKSKPTGKCSKRSAIYEELLQEPCDILIEGDENICDFFSPIRKSRYKVCCRNCEYFTPLVSTKELKHDQ